MLRKLGYVWMTAAVLLLTSPLMAQGEGRTSQTWFSMFFIVDDFLGQFIIAVLLLGSVFVMGFSIQMTMKYRRSTLLPQDTFNQVQQMIEARQFREAIARVQRDDSYLGKLVSAAMGEGRNGYSAMERALEETADVETTRSLRAIEYLNIVGNIAPMLGLFGTVYGMILAFQKLVEAGGKPDVGNLAGGISTALVTTFWGLIVAMPALAAYALIRNRIDALTAEGTLMAEQLIRPFKPSNINPPRPQSQGENADTDNPEPPAPNPQS